MGKGFWNDLKKPFFALAPMDDVTDTVFRRMVCKIARPDVFYTEFASVDALNSPGREKTLDRLRFHKSERPVVAQVWGLEIENFKKAAKDIFNLGFDGIDINMGCPKTDVIKKGACAALINNPKKAKVIIEAVKKGAGGLPVSVKTRLGVKEIMTEEWIKFLLAQDLDAITIHARTAKEMSNTPAHWDEIRKAVLVRNKLGKKTLIIGNGDVVDYQDGASKAKETGVDGIMIGRGIFSDVWVFEHPKTEHTLEENLQLLLGHAALFEKTWGNKKKFASLRKFFKAYVHSFESASTLRAQLVQSSSKKDVVEILKGSGFSGLKLS